ncbi:BRO-N domain-containing protein [Pseudomonas indica]|uniref:BRO-N domain-containing protein n=1 Tax=Pseudomonas indica TaxID=137658 RepID=UPI0015954638|nr:BRO family protein [Pseudomonas indica]
MEESYFPLLLMRHNRPLRGVMIDRQPWVCAKEFGLLMGHRHPERICRLMDDDQVRTVTFCTHQGNSEPVQLLSESGLYRALCRFSHPENRGLRRWLTHEALPALRDAWEGRAQEPRRTLMAWDHQRISLLQWQGDLWIALRDMPRFTPPPQPGERSLRVLLNRWWRGWPVSRRDY